MSAEMKKDKSEISGEVREMQKEFGSERADTLSRIASESAQEESMQSPTRV